MEDQISGTTGSVTLPNGAQIRVVRWAFSVTGGVLRSWSGTFIAALHDSQALWDVGAAIEVEFVDERGTTWTGAVTPNRVPARPGPVTVTFQGAGALRRNGEVYHRSAF